jgi:hypothetical protein
MTQKSSNATDDRTHDNLKLCGCSRHTPYSFSETKVDRLHNPRDTSGGAGNIGYPRLAIAYVEHTLVFGSEDDVTLEDVNVAGKTPFFASDGYLTDFSGRKIPGSQILAALPVDLARFIDTLKWPPAQREPFDKLPVDATNANAGFARNSFNFGDGSSIVSVGAALPKLLLLKDGGAMFWVTSCQAIAQSKGKYEGARGIQSFSGSSYFPVWPASPEDQVRLLAAGFKAKIHRCIKLVLRADHQGA